MRIRVRGSLPVLTTAFILSYICTVLKTSCNPTPWNRVLIGKATYSQLVKEFPEFYETQTVFTRALHLFLTWARSNQFIPPTYFLLIHLNTVEVHLSGLIGMTRHPDMQKIRIIGFFFENRHFFKLGCYYLKYAPASKPFDHTWIEVL